MKVFLNNTMHDSENGPITLVFDNDQQRKKVAQDLLDMPDSDDIRLYLTYNDEIEGFNPGIHLSRVYKEAGGNKRVLDNMDDEPGKWMD